MKMKMIAFALLTTMSVLFFMIGWAGISYVATYPDRLVKLSISMTITDNLPSLAVLVFWFIGAIVIFSQKKHDKI